MFKVMFIDDDPMVLRMAGFMMKKIGHTALTVSSANEVMATAKDSRPDIIFVDAEMPDMNGLDVIKMIKSDTDTADIPVYMMSGTVSQELKVKAISLGAAGVVEKPLKAPEIVKIVSTI